MTVKRLAAANAAFFFLFWLLVLLAGADHPPPPGFLLLVLLDLACALVVFWRVPTYVNWYLGGHRNKVPRVLLEGALAGFAVGAVPVIVTSAVERTVGGELSITPSAVDVAIWFAVLGVVGLLNALTLYAINVFIARRYLPAA